MTLNKFDYFWIGWCSCVLFIFLYPLVIGLFITPNNNSTPSDNNPRSLGNIPQFNSSQSVPLK